MKLLPLKQRSFYSILPFSAASVKFFLSLRPAFSPRRNVRGCRVLFPLLVFYGKTGYTCPHDLTRCIGLNTAIYIQIRISGSRSAEKAETGTGRRIPEKYSSDQEEERIEKRFA
jgi:hypothetical protein